MEKLLKMETNTQYRKSPNPKVGSLGKLANR
jgi:hypothetical protein